MASERRILIVEDSPTMQRMYRLVLGGLDGVALIMADDGVAGLDLAAQHPDVDVVIADINMPRMDGLEFIRRLRRELGLERPRVLVISTESDSVDRRLADEAGADAYLSKPVQPDALARLVREQLSHATAD